MLLRSLILLSIFILLWRINGVCQTYFKGYLYDYNTETNYEVNMKRDTSQGYSSYLTIYTVWNQKQKVDSKPLMRITIINFYNSHSITLDVELNPESAKPTRIS